MRSTARRVTKRCGGGNKITIVLSGGGRKRVDDEFTVRSTNDYTRSQVARHCQTISLNEHGAEETR
mgnify:CR=1 FL=1